MSMDGTKEIKTLEIRSIPHLWQSPGPISGIFFVDDGPGLLPTIMVFSYWDSDDEAFRSTFIQLVAPMFPEHEKPMWCDCCRIINRWTYYIDEFNGYSTTTI
jgi:hypothetical protein